MSFTNMDNRHFTDPEKTTINNAISTLETAIAAKGLAPLSAEDRKRYGSVNEQNKLVISKVKDFRDTNPGLSSPDIDWTEFNNDYITRAFLQNTIQRLQTMLDGIESAKMLHDFDNYTAALTDYDYTKYKAGTPAQGYKKKAEILSQFFTGRPSSSTTTENKNDNPNQS